MYGNNESMGCENGLDEESGFWGAFCHQTWQVLALGKDKNEWFKLKDKLALNKQERVVWAMERVEKEVVKRSVETRYRWLTSVVWGRRFVPVSVQDAGEARWSEGEDEKKEVEEAEEETKEVKAKDYDISGISQNPAINNCSFVASLINIRQRASPTLAVTHAGPGWYNVNLHFNGAANRLVQVHAPRLTKQPVVLSADLADRALENAYMQVKNNSSYRFDGSNSAVDTFLLNGFIPEALATHKISFQRIATIFKSSACLITLGTGATARDPQFLPCHDYPVIGIADDTSPVIRDPLDALNTCTLSQQQFSENFQVAYLNWDFTKLFARHSVLSFKYDISQNRFSPSPVEKPIYEVVNRSDTAEPIWVLLERHLGHTFTENDFCHLGLVSSDLQPSVQSSNSSNLGFSLLKLELGPGDRKLVACHSNVSANYSIHFYHVSGLVQAQKYDKNQNSASVDGEWDATTNFGSFSSPFYYMNPTFELLINTRAQTTHYIDMQLISDESAAVNAQVYHCDDAEFARPLTMDNTYESKVYARRAIPLATNTRYHVVCSCFRHDIKDKFKLIVVDSTGCDSLKLKRIVPQFGPYRYHDKYDFRWNTNNRKKIQASSELTTKAQLRILPLQPCPTMSIRVSIFTKNTKTAVFTTNEFSKVPKYGIILKDITLLSREPLVLLVEKDGPSNAFEDTVMRLELGSDFTVAIDGV
ncbi:LAME_0A00848g1_1 [Lachancea meyersii CBS 8951]|uniref:Cysteine protease RIM13 n=1 Tax=Lachancea meyersii CBS 8951 TaxID=1266667 RepID=A0A1G4ILC3_9SACH|nr:LAME_0A00848g1_1 [Lachancea meyersii CBS 8951]